jgi:hypothetical protein
MVHFACAHARTSSASFHFHWSSGEARADPAMSRHGMLASGPAYQPEYKQQNHGASRRAEHDTEETRRQRNAELWEKPAADERAGDADDDVANQAESATLHDHAGEPASNCADGKPNQNHFTTHISLLSWARVSRGYKKGTRARTASVSARAFVTERISD